MKQKSLVQPTFENSTIPNSPGNVTAKSFWEILQKIAMIDNNEFFVEQINLESSNDKVRIKQNILETCIYNFCRRINHHFEKNINDIDVSTFFFSLKRKQYEKMQVALLKILSKNIIFKEVIDFIQNTDKAVIKKEELITFLKIRGYKKGSEQLEFYFDRAASFIGSMLEKTNIVSLRIKNREREILINKDEISKLSLGLWFEAFNKVNVTKSDYQTQQNTINVGVFDKTIHWAACEEACELINDFKKKIKNKYNYKDNDIEELLLFALKSKNNTHLEQ